MKVRDLFWPAAYMVATIAALAFSLWMFDMHWRSTERIAGHHVRLWDAFWTY